MSERGGFGWRTAAKIAWREVRGSSTKFLFVVFSVAVGVGSLTGVRGFSKAFGGMLLKEARTLMAADLTVRVFALPDKAQAEAIRKLEERGARMTQITETLTMVSSQNKPEPVLVSVKAVDPGRFPFYGSVELSTGKALREALTPESAVLDDDLLIRLKAQVGDTIRIGGQDFRVAATVMKEPDRMSGSLNVGPRLMISRDGLARTELIRLGSRAAQRFLFKLSPETPVALAREQLKQVFPEALIVDFREGNPNIERALDQATTFLSLVSLIALIVGSLGVGTSMHAHLQQKLDSIAILKSIGARSGQVIRIYALQTLMLGLIGGVVGVGIGAAIQRFFPVLIARYFQIEPEVSWNVMTALQGLLAGLLTTLLFTVPPLMGIRRIRPNLVFRRDMMEQRKSWREWLRNGREALLSGLLIALGAVGIAAWLIEGSWRDIARIGGIFLGALLVSLAVMAGAAVLLLRGLEAFVRHSPVKLKPELRHGLANIYRPGSQSRAVLTALGIGVMFTLTVFLVQRGVIQEMARSAPPGMANVFLLDITREQQEPLRTLLRQQQGVLRDPDLVPTVSSKLLAVDGVPMEQLGLTGFARRFRMMRPLTETSRQPDGMTILQGEWWKQDKPGMVSVSEAAARGLKLKPGSKLTWDSFGRRVELEVACVHRAQFQRLASLFDFILSPGPLSGLPTVGYGALRVEPAKVAALQRASYEQFPTVTVVNVADVLERIQEVVDQVALIVRFISAFAILAGITILASSVAGTRFRRVREVVILKTLGATRRRIAGIFSAEFLILGTVAGLLGSAMASGLTALVLKQLLRTTFHFDWVPNVLCVLLTAVLATAAGWAASFRILGQKPLEVLRGE